MTTKEALLALLDGKKVRNKTWSSYIYMYFDGDILLDSNGIKFNNLSMHFMDDWEIYEEPKPKQTVVIEKWLCKGEEGFVILEGDNSFQISHDYEKVKLLDTYEEEL